MQDKLLIHEISSLSYTSHDVYTWVSKEQGFREFHGSWGCINIHGMLTDKSNFVLFINYKQQGPGSFKPPPVEEYVAGKKLSDSIIVFGVVLTINPRYQVLNKHSLVNNNFSK